MLSVDDHISRKYAFKVNAYVQLKVTSMGVDIESYRPYDTVKRRVPFTQIYL